MGEHADQESRSGEKPPGGDSRRRQGDKGSERSAPSSKNRVDHEAEDQKEAKNRSAVGAHVVHEAILLEGEEELNRPTSALAWSGLAAGLSMGFSPVTEGLLRSHLPDRPWRPLIAKLGYSMGFLIVILGRQQLFTENTLTPILPLMKKKTMRVFWNVMRLWGVVLVTNLVGATLFGLVLSRTGVFEAAVRHSFLEIGQESMEHSFGIMLLRGIFAGWLIALMVWLLPFAEVARVWVILILTYIVGLGQFSHIIAGSVESAYVVWSGQAGLGQFLGGFIVPTLLGNIVGGVSLVAALNHAQVLAGGGQDE